VTGPADPGRAGRPRPGPLARIGHDPDALEAFCTEHVTAVTRFVARRVADPHTAADLTAEVFLVVIYSGAPPALPRAGLLAVHDAPVDPPPRNG